VNGQPLDIADRKSLDAACEAILAAARYRLTIYQPALEPGILDSDVAIDQCRRIATGGRHAGIHILTHDAVQALRDSHRLIALCQRLPSTVQLRVPTEPRDLAYGSAFLLNDVGGYLFRPDPRRNDARSAYDAPGETAALQGYFDDVWERAMPAAEIRSLSI
jgi:hypothetical protein